MPAVLPRIMPAESHQSPRLEMVRRGSPRVGRPRLVTMIGNQIES
jgi:hypothetical protein